MAELTKLGNTFDGRFVQNPDYDAIRRALVRDFFSPKSFRLPRMPCYADSLSILQNLAVSPYEAAKQLYVSQSMFFVMDFFLEILNEITDALLIYEIRAYDGDDYNFAITTVLFYVAVGFAGLQLVTRFWVSTRVRGRIQEKYKNSVELP